MKTMVNKLDRIKNCAIIIVDARSFLMMLNYSIKGPLFYIISKKVTQGFDISPKMKAFFKFTEGVRTSMANEF